jgi:hypothetical protein
MEGERGRTREDETQRTREEEEEEEEEEKEERQRQSLSCIYYIYSTGITDHGIHFILPLSVITRRRRSGPLPEF